MFVQKDRQIGMYIIPMTNRQYRRYQRGKNHITWERMLWTRLTCNWLVLGVACHIKGHQQRVDTTIHYDYVENLVAVDGVVRFEKSNGRTIKRVHACGRCGKYFGVSTEKLPKSNI